MMKIKLKVITIYLLLIIGTINALDTSSSQFISLLVNLQEAGTPQVIDDGVLFTVPASFGRVGIAFAHEGFATMHWFRKLLVPEDAPNPRLADDNIPPPVTYRDSGLLFFAYTVPQDIETVEYRLIINGLWTADPLNPVKRVDDSGVARSVAPKPVISRPLTPNDAPAGTATFRFEAPSGERVYVAGSFNNWDPFMYELKEKKVGLYEISLPLPPGTYQYAFFHRGERRLDQSNFERVYRDGLAVSQVIIK